MNDVDRWRELTNPGSERSPAEFAPRQNCATKPAQEGIRRRDIDDLHVDSIRQFTVRTVRPTCGKPLHIDAMLGEPPEQSGAATSGCATFEVRRLRGNDEDPHCGRRETGVVRSGRRVEPRPLSPSSPSMTR